MSGRTAATPDLEAGSHSHSAVPTVRCRRRRRGDQGTNGTIGSRMDIATASEQALRVRRLYHRLEQRLEGSAWTVKDDMLGLVNDIGAVSRLVMASEGRWTPEGDVKEQTAGKRAECMWWILVLADRL